jgi:hypothetical protein
MGWNNGTNSNQLYRPEASRLLTGAPADKETVFNLEVLAEHDTSVD